MTNANVIAFLPCGECRFWSELPQGRFASSPDWGKCARAESNMGSPEDGTTLAYASDMESYAADLRTKATFGCVQAEPWQPNEKLFQGIHRYLLDAGHVVNHATIEASYNKAVNGDKPGGMIDAHVLAYLKDNGLLPTPTG